MQGDDCNDRVQAAPTVRHAQVMNVTTEASQTCTRKDKFRVNLVCILFTYLGAGNDLRVGSLAQ